MFDKPCSLYICIRIFVKNTPGRRAVTDDGLQDNQAEPGIEQTLQRSGRGWTALNGKEVIQVIQQKGRKSFKAMFA